MLGNHQDILKHIEIVLYYYSSLVRGIEKCVYNRAIVDTGRGFELTRTYYLLHLYVDERREQMERPTLYKRLERYARKRAIDRGNFNENIMNWAKRRCMKKQGDAASH